jgi:plastocyanin
MKTPVLVMLVVLGGAAAVRGDVHGCSFANALDLRGQPTVTVNFGGILGLAYAPACIRVNVATAVSFAGNFIAHPLVGGRADGGIPIPEPGSPIQPTNTGTLATFSFPNGGEFGYYCDVHFSASMYGAVLVYPEVIFADGFDN